MSSKNAGYSKITIRQPTALKRKIAQAAAMRGMTVMSFINHALARVTEQTIERTRRRELSERDQKLLLEMLTKPKGPNKKLIRAARRYKERYGA